MLERRLLSQRKSPGAQPQAEADQRDEEQQRGEIEQESITLRRRLDSLKAVGEQRASLFESFAGGGRPAEVDEGDCQAGTATVRCVAFNGHSVKRANPHS
jgi:hypothetical protein